MDHDLIICQLFQSSVIQRRAAPRLIQKSGCFSVGRCKKRQKLVEWPVVLNSPARMDVLYSGQWKFLLVSRVSILTGLSQTTGNGTIGVPI